MLLVIKVLEWKFEEKKNINRKERRVYKMIELRRVIKWGIFFKY